jgi:hypothetical protein
VAGMGSLQQQQQQQQGSGIGRGTEHAAFGSLLQRPDAVAVRRTRTTTSDGGRAGEQYCQLALHCSVSCLHYDLQHVLMCHCTALQQRLLGYLVRSERFEQLHHLAYAPGHL